MTRRTRVIYTALQRPRFVVSAVTAGVALLLLTSCGTVAAKSSGPNRSALASPSGYSGYSFWPSGSNGSSGSYPTGPTGPSGAYSSGPTGPTGCTGPSGGAGWLTYGLCVTWGISGAVNSVPLRTDVGFPCQLAVSNGSPGTGGFITLPGGQFTLDPHSDVAISYPAGTQPGMGRPPALSLSYSHRTARWYPVSRESVGPDGSRYAYSLDNTGIHVIKVADGSDSVLGNGQAWRVLMVDRTGVYAVPADRTLGLWFLPLTGTVRQVTDKGSWFIAGSGVAFGQEAQSLPTGVSNPLLHLDLQSGAVQTWWSEAPAGAQLLTIEGDGSLLVTLPSSYPNGGPQIVDVRRLSAPEQLGSVIVGPIGSVSSPVVADSHGVWLSFTSLGNPTYTWFISAQGYWPISKISGELASGCD